MRSTLIVLTGTGLIAACYGMVRLAYGLFLPDVQASVGLTSAAAGVVASAASLAYCAGALLGVAGLGARPLVLLAWLTAAGGSVGMVLAPDVATFAPAAVVASAGAGLASPGMVGIVERHLAGAARDRAQAVVNTGTGPGLVVAGSMALVVLPDWRLGFAISAAVTVACGLAVLGLDRAGAPVRPTGRRTARPRLPWRGLLRPVVGALLLGAGSAAVWTYGRSHLVAAGAGATGSVVAWIAIGLGGTACVLTARRLQRLPAARAWALTVATVAVSTGALAVAAGHRALSLAACAVFGWGFVAATSALIAWASELAPDTAGAGTGLLFVVLVVGQAAGAPLVAAVPAGPGLAGGFGVAAAVATLALAPAVRSPLPRRVTCATVPS